MHVDRKTDVLCTKKVLTCDFQLCLPFAVKKAVIRILGGSRNLPDLDGLGMDKRAVSLIRRSLRDAKGLIIICGPTGSGKTTTLYAALREIDKESVSIATLEDPVEYKIDGLSQSQIGKKRRDCFS